MAKGVPVSGDRFTERSPNGVMGIAYNFVAKTAAVIVAGGKKHRGFLRNVGRLMK